MTGFSSIETLGWSGLKKKNISKTYFLPVVLVKNWVKKVLLIETKNYKLFWDTDQNYYIAGVEIRKYYIIDYFRVSLE